MSEIYIVHRFYNHAQSTPRLCGDIAGFYRTKWNIRNIINNDKRISQAEHIVLFGKNLCDCGKMLANTAQYRNILLYESFFHTTQNISKSVSTFFLLSTNANLLHVPYVLR